LETLLGIVEEDTFTDRVPLSRAEQRSLHPDFSLAFCQQLFRGKYQVFYCLKNQVRVRVETISCQTKRLMDRIAINKVGTHPSNVNDNILDEIDK
jgi:hypothetical protein